MGLTQVPVSAGLIRNFSAVVAVLVTGSDGLAIDDTAQPRNDAAETAA